MSKLPRKNDTTKNNMKKGEHSIMIKVDLITGFLGSGKTTFIKYYVQYLIQKGEKIGIIENDYGAINVDMLLLSQEFGDQCGMEMVVASDPDCHRRRFKTKLIAMGMEGYDRVIVEPSGIYDVDEFFDILYEEPLDRWYTIGNVIAIVDAKLEQKMSKESDYLLVSQIAEAGKVIFSKTGDATLSDFENTIQHMNNALTQFQCRRQYHFPNINSETNDVLLKPWETLSDADFEQIESCGYVPEDHIKMMVTSGNNYRSLFFFHVKMSEDDIKDTVNELFLDPSYGHIYRIKGFVPKTEDCWIQLNATANRIDIVSTPVGQEVIIVIGENLMQDKIAECITKRSDNKEITIG